jgi:hypothetical protein
MATIKKHPTHLKNTGYVGGLLLIFALSSFGIGIYLQQNNRIDLSHIFAFTFLISSALLLVWLIFRMKLCKCPTCGKWLSERTITDKHTSRKFICRKCNTIWETGYTMHFTMDDPS